MAGNINPLSSLERNEPANDAKPEALAPDARRPSQHRTAGALLIAGPVIFLLAEFIAAAAWTNPPYSYTHHFISNLGVHGPSTLFGQYMYSPLAWVMNTGFFLFGITILAGIAVLRGLLGWRRWAALVPATLLAVGGVLLGLFPGSGEAMNDGTGDFHALGALAGFVGGNVLAIALGSMRRRVGLSLRLGRTLVTVGVIGLVSMVAYFADLISGANVLVGLIERGAVHPFLLGLSCAGVALWHGCSRPSATV
ncbi:DUF998 domain-containing protein [Sphaerisporangium aureirubrum]|uniref:DUF998 domain-containing protein n=1 Tax=Sphaerisporangium aureirubrum TaxID=1544736 RepID=A0ABW1NNV3_9ACTN